MWYFTVKILSVEGNFPNFRAQCTFVHIMQDSSASPKSPGYLAFHVLPLSLFSLWGVGGKAPPAAFSAMTTFENRGAGQHFGALFFPTSTGHCSFSRESQQSSTKAHCHFTSDLLGQN